MRKKLQAPVRSDGTFEFRDITPGAYWLAIPKVPTLEPLYIAVDWDGADVTIPIPAR